MSSLAGSRRMHNDINYKFAVYCFALHEAGDKRKRPQDYHDRAAWVGGTGPVGFLPKAGGRQTMQT